MLKQRSMGLARFDPKSFLAAVGEGKTVTAYRTGQAIFKQGQPADLVFYLQSGKAKETVISQAGKEAVIGVLEPGQFFGTSGLNGNSSRISTVTAVTACVVTAINEEAMQMALHRPKFAQLFMAYLLEYNSRIEAEKVDLLFNSSEKRLAQKLLILAHAGEGAPQVIGPEITQEMLADMIGSTRQHVNHFLNKFRQLGFIKYNGGILVMPPLLKAMMVETPQEKDKQ